MQVDLVGFYECGGLLVVLSNSIAVLRCRELRCDQISTHLDSSREVVLRLLIKFKALRRAERHCNDAKHDDEYFLSTP